MAQICPVIPDGQTWCLQSLPRLSRGSPEPETHLSPPPAPTQASTLTINPEPWGGLALPGVHSDVPVGLLLFSALMVSARRKGWKRGTKQNIVACSVSLRMSRVPKKVSLASFLIFLFLFIGGGWAGAQDLTCARCV